MKLHRPDRSRIFGISVVCPLFAAMFLTTSTSPAATRYVDVNSANPTPPYTDWSTAAATIQQAVDAADPGDQILVTNGVYRSGGRVAVETGSGSGSNRVAVTKPLVLQSVNGPEFTVIQAYPTPVTNSTGAMRCVYLTNGASLSGFTLANGATWGSFWGAGVWCQSTNSVVVSNCVLAGNFTSTRGAGAYAGTLLDCLMVSNSTPPISSSGGGAYGGILVECTLMGNSSAQGGGASVCTLTNCTLVGNRADYGGGAFGGALNNCLLTGNSAKVDGGGAAQCVLRNCTVTGNAAGRYAGGSAGGYMVNSIVYFNTAPQEANYFATRYSFCCTTPEGGYGVTNAPLFVDPANGNFRLQSNSPCINAGFNPSVMCSTDLDGGLRIAGGTVDLGAYEFQTPTSLLSYAWAQQYGLPTDGSMDFADSDTDRMNNWQEWFAGTVPTDASSVLKLLSPQPQPDGTVVSWQSVPGKSYLLERATDLGAAPVFSTVSSNILGQPGTTSFKDTDAPSSGPVFYRVGVKP